MIAAVNLKWYATLAEAAYSLFDELPSEGRGTSYASALTERTLKGEMAATQAMALTGTWAISDHLRDTHSGLSATLFRDLRSDGVGHVLAVRGTDFNTALDLQTDLGDIVADGLAIKQIIDLYNYWKSLTTPTGQIYQAAKLVDYSSSLSISALLRTRSDIVSDSGDARQIVFQDSDEVYEATSDLRHGQGVLSADAQVIVTGHSLGGHLAAAFARLFRFNAAEAVGFNGAGFGTDLTRDPLGVISLNVGNLFHTLGGADQFDPTKYTNYYGSKGAELVAMDKRWGLTQPGQWQGMSNEYDPWTFGHGIGSLTDASSGVALLASLDGALGSASALEQIRKVNPIAAASAASDDAKNEALVESVARMFLAASPSSPPLNDREPYYALIRQVENTTAYKDARGHLALASTVGASTSEIATKTRLSDAEGLAYRYALTALNPFVLIGADYALHTLDSALVRESSSPLVGHLSENWIDDRSQMLAWKNASYLQDSSTYRVSTSSNATATDLEYGIVINIVGTVLGGSSTAPPSALTFGTRVGDSIVGTALADRLYGMAGNDAIDGAHGDDYVEGGAGDDTLRGGAGKDVLAGGRNSDQLFGGTEDDRLDGGAGIDMLKGEAGRDVLVGGLDGDTLEGGVDRDRLFGGAGSDDYVLVTGDGDDVIADEDGQGEITVNTSPLTGGALVATNRWHRLGVTYDFVPNADGRGDLAIRWGTSTTIVRGFRPGDLGIILDPGAVNAPAPGATIAGTSGDDNNLDGAPSPYILGTPSAERIRGLAGRDQLIAQGGNDVLEGGAGNDILVGENGDDWLYAGDAVELAAYSLAQSTVAGTALQGDWLDGGNGKDTLVGSENMDALFGGLDADVVEGAGGTDMILGDTEGGPARLDWTRVQEGGAWVLTPANYAPATSGAADLLRGGGGDDVINGEWGDDTLHGNDGNDQLTGYQGRDVMFGGKGNDLIVGDASGWAGIAAAAGATDWLFGGEGNDDLRGDGGDDQLYGDEGNDRLEGGDGDDLIDGWTGNDTVIAGAGNDTIIGDNGDDGVDGGTGDDTIDGGVGDDSILGGAGADTISGGDGIDQVAAGDGDDTVDAGAGDDQAEGGLGADTIRGGDGVDLLAGGEGIDNLDGGIGDDVLYGDAGDDIVTGGDGDDGVYGGTGRDTLAGDAGNDHVFGDEDDDWLQGALGHDMLDGGDGNDVLDGGDGANVLVGGAGNDHVTGGMDGDYIRGGDGDDDVAGMESTDLIDPGNGNDTIRLSLDAPDFYIGLGLGDRLLLPDGVEVADVDFMRAADENGGAGHLAVMVGGQPVAIMLDVDDNARPTFQTFAGTTIASTTINAALSRHSGEFLPIRLPGYTGTGTGRADVFVAPGGAANYASGDGDDHLTGAAMADALSGDAGDDTLAGAAGNDYLDGGIGNDSLDGGDDRDMLSGGEGSDTILGGKGDDTLRGGEGNDALQGGSGGDRIEGDDGDDALDGGDGRDALFGGTGRDQLVGGAGNDALEGGDGVDTLDGGIGNDTLSGGAGNDLLEGGAGDDTYVLDGLGADRIADTSGVSTVRFAAGITSTSIALSRGATGSADEHALIVDFGGGHHTVIEEGLLRGPSRFTFEDGTTVSRADLLGSQYAAPLALSADANLRTVAGGAGADALGSGSAPHAELRGGASHDTLTGNEGTDRLFGDTGNDSLVSAGGIDYLHGGDGDDALDAGDGDDLLDGGAGNDVLSGGAGRDLVLGGQGEDTLGGDAGDDVLRGGEGDDTYRLANGSGTDAVQDSAGANRVRFGPGVAIADAMFRTSGNTLIAALADGSRVVLPNALDEEHSAATRIAGFDFDSGSLSLADAVARATGYIAGDSAPSPTLSVGTDGDDALGGGNRVYGGRGDDTIGSSGTYLFGFGDGHDTISVSNSPGKQTPSALVHWIEMLPGVTRQDVAFGIDGDDLLVTLRPSGDSIRVLDHFDRYGPLLSWSYPSAIAGVRFADGSSLAFNMITQAIESGTDGNDRIGVADGLFGVIDGGDGDDVVELFETSSDVLGGDGDDRIAASPYRTGDYSYLFGQGGDDTLVASTALNARTYLDGGEGDDRLVGAPGARLNGGPGDDRIVIPGGATGGPTEIVWGRFSDRDTVTGGGDSGELGPAPSFSLSVMAGSYRDLQVQRDGDDLVLAIRDRDDRLAVPDFFAAGSGYAGFAAIDEFDPALEISVRRVFEGAALAARAIVVESDPLDFTGASGSDLVVAAGNADTLDGAAGDDELDGMSGDDRLHGGSGNDLLYGRSGLDTLDGGEGDDRLYGGRGDDVSRGGAGNDRIVDAYGDNAADGGAGADVIVLGGLHGFALGGDGEDTLMSTAGDHLLVGEAGDDTLSGSGARVELDGGAGDDALWIDASTATGAAAQVIVHFGRGGGVDVMSTIAFASSAIDEIRLGPAIAQADVAIRREGSDMILSLAGSPDTLRLDGAFSGDQVAVASITLADGGALDRDAILALARSGSPFDDHIVGTSSDDTIDGGDGDDTIDGRAGHDALDGGAGTDTLLGDLGNDVLDGGAGVDTMRGGTGDDVYFVDAPGETVLEFAGEGVDEVRSTVTRDAGANVERLRLLGTADIDAYGTSGNDDLGGNAGRNAFYADLGDDILAGGAGDDSYIVDDGGDTIIELANEGFDTVYASTTTTLAAQVENLWIVSPAAADATGNSLDNTLTGGAGANVLSGLGGHDVLDGQGGADRMVGGAGDDRYVVDHASDAVVEVAGEGLDTVGSTIAYVLPSDVEDLVLLGSGSIAATGNALANRLTGNTGANTLDGKAGADTMLGGKGNDIYVVDAAGDLVTELASEGADTVQSSVSFVLGANVEHLTLTGAAAISASGNTAANTLVGNAASNTLDGGAGSDTLRGSAGDDTYVVDATGDAITENASEGMDTVRSTIAWTLGANLERLVLTGTASVAGTGNTLANALTGNAGANLLDGKAGADAMAGGAGNDTYVVDATGDSVTENAGEGTDLVQSSVAWTLAANVENLTLTGTTAINATGNTLANTLVGNAAANVLNGGSGNDTMRGGAGNDTYVVDATGDVTTENASEGTDHVQSSIAWTLATNVENLTLTGAAAINGTGNALANTLVGNAAANILDGKALADAMSGGGGDDVYIVDNAGDITTEAASAGIDRVEASVTRTLSANIEDLTLTGSAAINGTGNTLSNRLVGNAAINTLAGGDGNDHLFGAAGNDVLAGGNGIDVLQGGDGNDAIGDTAGNTLLDGGLGVDTITGSSARELVIGGKGDDTLSTGTGADVIAFNRGDGRDTLVAAAGADDTLSLGGGIRYADLGLTKVGNDLVLDAGADQVTLKDWYLAATNRRVASLQVVVEASTDYAAASSDPTRNRRVARFDFAEIATAFDAARTANPALTRWTMSGALPDAFVAGSDTAALGGDLAYAFGRGGSLATIGMGAAGSILGDASFGLAAQSFLTPAELAAGGRFLR